MMNTIYKVDKWFQTKLLGKPNRCIKTTKEYFQTNGISEKIDVNTLATNLYVEASNSNNYIQDAYQMLVPVLQVRLLEAID
ncbi:hypothetical protein TNCV_647611 [Trichonephila clavipes]|uniref:Uncharacterized protein n=1 Tax=Trichonephila clavipes TaxID=2585209 RepID=A0A8X6SJ69_TRICX|nr:hypothetical protein TNCV_647611 [Trichonephila clavipes]